MKGITIVLILLFLTITSFSYQDCNELSYSFSSYPRALSEIKSTDFKLEDSVNTSRSSGIESAIFFSCDKYIEDNYK